MERSCPSCGSTNSPEWGHRKGCGLSRRLRPAGERCPRALFPRAAGGQDKALDWAGWPGLGSEAGEHPADRQRPGSGHSPNSRRNPGELPGGLLASSHSHTPGARLGLDALAQGAAGSQGLRRVPANPADSEPAACSASRAHDGAAVRVPQGCAVQAPLAPSQADPAATRGRP